MNSRQRLIEDAKKKGLRVVEAYGRVTILRTTRDGVIVWADGSITRYNLVNSTTMSVAQARKVLQLTQGETNV